VVFILYVTTVDIFDELGMKTVSQNKPSARCNAFAGLQRAARHSRSSRHRCSPVNSSAPKDVDHHDTQLGTIFREVGFFVATWRHASCNGCNICVACSSRLVSGSIIVTKREERSNVVSSCTLCLRHEHLEIFPHSSAIAVHLILFPRCVGQRARLLTGDHQNSAIHL
jgi:hypothetical protein